MFCDFRHNFLYLIAHNRKELRTIEKNCAQSRQTRPPHFCVVVSLHRVLETNTVFNYGNKEKRQKTYRKGTATHHTGSKGRTPAQRCEKRRKSCALQNEMARRNPYSKPQSACRTQCKAKTHTLQIAQRYFFS